MALPAHFFDATGRLTLIAGPCQLESADHAMMMATALKEAAKNTRFLSCLSPVSTKPIAPAYRANAG